MSNAFTKTPEVEPAPDVNGFSIKAWSKGTGLVTRSVAVCGMPQLMGQIEALKDAIERAQASSFDDERPLVKTQAMRLAEELETARQQMLASMTTWTFRSLRNGELEALKTEHGPDEDGITDLDYKVWARQCVRITDSDGETGAYGIAWEDLKALHVGNGLAEDDPEHIEGLGAYFVQTIARTANVAASGGGVDIPFSSASSALIANSSKN